MALQIGTRTLPLQGFARLGEMRRSQLSELSDAELQQRMDLDGYLYLPGLIPREAVLAGQRSIVSVSCHRSKLLFRDDPLPPFSSLLYLWPPSPPSPPSPDCLVLRKGLSAASDNPIFDEARGERALLPGRERSSPPVGWLQESGEVMRVLEGQELFGVFGRLYGGPASTFDYKWFRAIGEGAVSLPRPPAARAHRRPRRHATVAGLAVPLRWDLYESRPQGRRGGRRSRGAGRPAPAHRLGPVVSGSPHPQRPASVRAGSVP
eukprot:SAG11_NODE_38_length_21705_cov_24.667453_17_plen_263_part_00